MRKMLLFLFEGYCEFEVTVAISMIRNEVEVVTVASDRLPIRSEAGLVTIPDLSLNEVAHREYEGIIIPGGDLKPVVDMQSIYDLTADLYTNNKIVASICSGVYIPAKAGVLKGQTYTVTLSGEQRDFLGSFEETGFVYEPVVQTGNLLTAQGHAYAEFAVTLAEMLGVSSENKAAFYSGKRNVMMETN
ncbi:DJ-1/PfpI family protein [Jeotgalibacillus aurantiacus]|uniref:DJ-1/PfpI family protein n=1 Tax=Jeotgalibacillus aurantiacus TaxID=2763266 RepID=UPI001D09A96A|nr:DJ-1/PfpI family protein [Jeotgalibacillus aurantiacus]